MMKFSTPAYHQTRHLLDPPPSRHRQDWSMSPNPSCLNEKVIVVMGATGAGKSRLSIDLANQFWPAEIINSDKIQFHKGLDIVTNKISDEEKSGVPHHLLGFLDPNAEFNAADFCGAAEETIQSISRRESLPIIVGGSNTYIEAFVNSCRFRMDYEFCFLWVDVARRELHDFLRRRVDQMVENGMIEEVRNAFDPKADYSRGIKRAIGVPEYDTFLRLESILAEKDRARLLDEAISDVKKNNCVLADKQLEKIRRLKNIKGWDIHRLDATQVFQRRGKDAADAWEKLVARPSAAIVRRFLDTEFPANVAATAAEYNARCALAMK